LHAAFKSIQEAKAESKKRARDQPAQAQGQEQGQEPPAKQAKTAEGKQATQKAPRLPLEAVFEPLSVALRPGDVLPKGLKDDDDKGKGTGQAGAGEGKQAAEQQPPQQQPQQLQHEQGPARCCSACTVTCSRVLPRRSARSRTTTACSCRHTLASLRPAVESRADESRPLCVCVHRQHRVARFCSAACDAQLQQPFVRTEPKAKGRNDFAKSFFPAAYGGMK
jgi:hypothetical protein